jgi:hypothetical protein
MKQPPELIVTFWPVTITAKGSEAIRAIQRPLAFVIFTRPFLILALAWLLPGDQAITLVKRWIGL